MVRVGLINEPKVETPKPVVEKTTEKKVEKPSATSEKKSRKTK